MIFFLISNEMKYPQLSKFYQNLFLGMLSHRMMTLGHTVATTRIPWQNLLGLHKKKKFNADQLLAKRGIEMMKEWQQCYQVPI